MINRNLTLEQRQEKLQNEYDLVCNMMIYCYKNHQTDGWNEYLWRKHQIEEIANTIGIDLLKVRSNSYIIERATKYNKVEAKNE